MRQFSLLVVLLVFVCGCGGSKSPQGTMKGKITYKGEPVNGATLYLDPTGGTTGGQITVPVTQEGTFNCTDIAPGEYKITIQGSTGKSGVPSMDKMDPAKAAQMKDKIAAMGSKPTIPFPKKYTNAVHSPLTQKIVAGVQEINLELTD